MKNANIIGNIYETNDYGMFKKLPSNRDVLSARLNKLIASISTKYILNPILVNGRMQIIDGQGRFEACKALKKPIRFIVDETATEADCRLMNKYNTKWNRLDFAKSFSKAGNENYTRLLRAVFDLGMTITKTLSITCHTNFEGASTAEMTRFEQGKLIFTEDDYERAKVIKRMCDEIIASLQYAGKLNDTFFRAVAIMTAFKDYNHNQMLLHCEQTRMTYTQMARLVDQLKEFERIYNYRISSKNRLYFSDYMRNKGSTIIDYSKINAYSVYTDTDVSTLQE